MNCTAKRMLSFLLVVVLLVSTQAPTALAREQSAEPERIESEAAPDTSTSPDQPNGIAGTESESEEPEPGRDGESELPVTVGEEELETLDLNATIEADAQQEVIFRNYGTEDAVGYATLTDAVTAAEAGETLTVTADLEISAKTPVNKSLTITDDGTAHTISFANATASSNNGRGLQVNGGATVTIRGSVQGGLALVGHGAGVNAGVYNYAAMLFVYNGTLVLEHLTVTGSSPSCAQSAVYGYYQEGTATGHVTVNGCTFSGNALPAGQSAGADILMNGDGVLTLIGCSSIPDISVPLTAPIPVLGSWSGAQIGLTVPAEEENNRLALGTQILGGESVEQAARCFTLSGLDNDLYCINALGLIAERPVARIERTGTTYPTLPAAVAAAATGDTITLLWDASLDASLDLSAGVDRFNLTITDDGYPHTVYVYNSRTGEENRYGRGMEIKNRATVTIRATSLGNLTLMGQSKDGSLCNYSAILYVYRGTLTLTNIRITGCCTSSYGVICTYNDNPTSSSSSVYTGTVNLNSCLIEDNTSKAATYGAAIYNQGNLNISGGTVIRNNASCWSKGGGIYNDVHTGKNGSGTYTGVTTLSGGVTVSGNMKGCTYQESAGVNHDGHASDIYAATPGSIRVSSLSGSVGVDYAGDDTGRFATATSTSVTGLECLHNNNDSTVDAVRSGTDLCWREFCSISLGVAAQGTGLTCSLPAAAVSVPSGRSGAALSVTVDRGQFSVDWELEALSTLGVTKVYYIDADGCYGSAAGVPDAECFRGLSVEGGWTAALAQTFLRSLVFSVETDGMSQSITAGLIRSVPAGSVYFGKSTYSFVSAPCSYANAAAAAEAAEGHLAVADSPLTDMLLTGVFGGYGYLGGRLLSDNWYWAAGRAEGTRISVSSSGSQGYENGYTNWADGQPAGGDVMVLDGGRWSAADGSGSCGYYLECEDGNASELTTILTTSLKENKLTSVSLSLEEGVAVNYYLGFTEALAADDGAYVEVIVGENEPLRYYVKTDILRPENLSAFGNAYRITVPVCARELNAVTELRFCCSGGRCLGSIGGSGKTQYNARWYAANVILRKDSGDSYNPSYSPDLIRLVKALLNYGAAAQSQFNYEIETPANAGYEDTTPLTDSAAISEGIVSYGEGKQYYIEMIADSTTVIRIRPLTEADFTAAVDGESAAVAQDAQGSYIDISLPVDKLTRIYTVAFSGGFEDTLTLNAAGVIKAMLQSGTDAQKATCDSLYKLSAAANSFYGVYTPAASTVESIINTAYAYLEKTEYIDYDQRQMTSNSIQSGGRSFSNSRRQTNVSPTDATAQSMVYMDCSSFCYNVYREVFGRDATLAALGGADESDMTTGSLIGCSTAARVSTWSVADGLDFAELRETLQPGDLIVKYRGGSDSHGHIVLWTGNGYIHCTGSSYNYTTGKDNTDVGGAIFFVPATDFSAYWYAGFNTVTVLRPLNVLGVASISEAAAGRRQIGPMAVSKTAGTVSGTELYQGRGVVIGETIRYSITLENRYEQGIMNTARTLTVTDTLPAGTSLIDAGGAEQSGTTLTWVGVTVPVGETVVLSYSVSVTASAGNAIAPTGGSCVSAAAGSAAASVSFCFPHEISVEGSCAAAVSAMISAANGKVSTSTDNAISALNEIINAGISGAGLCESDAGWVDALFGTTSGYYYVKNYSATTVPGKYLVSNFASGRRVLNYSTGGGRFDTDTRMRSLTVNNLQPGDVIAVLNDEEYTYYVFISDSRMVQLQSGSMATAVIGENVAATLTALLVQDCFAVFRVAGRA